MSDTIATTLSPAAPAIVDDAKELRRLLAYQRQLERLIATAEAEPAVVAIFSSLAAVHDGIDSSQPADTLGQLADYGREYESTKAQVAVLTGGDQS